MKHHFSTSNLEKQPLFEIFETTLFEILKEPRKTSKKEACKDRENNDIRINSELMGI